MRAYQMSSGAAARALRHCRFILPAAGALLGVVSFAAGAESAPPPPTISYDPSPDLTPAEPIGHGDGRIHIIPTLSAPSVKNGGKLTISAVVKAVAGVREVTAEIRDGERVIDTLELAPAPQNMVGAGGLGAFAGTSLTGPPAPDLAQSPSDSASSSFTLPPASFPQVGLWTADWTAHNLEEKNYTIRLRMTDLSGHGFEDESLQFSDPVVGMTVPGTTNYPDAALRRVGAHAGENESSLMYAAIDRVAGYAYFGTYTAPGCVVKVALHGTGLPTRVGALTLDAGEDYLDCAVIDPVAGYAYFGTDTFPGRFVNILPHNANFSKSRIISHFRAAQNTRILSETA